MTNSTPVLNTAAFSSVPEVTATYFTVVELSPKSTPTRPIYLTVVRPLDTLDEAQAALAAEAAKWAADSRNLPPRSLSVLEVQDVVSRTLTLH